MSQNLSQGPVQVFDNSVTSINDALRQIVDRMDENKGLRGRAVIHDRVGVSDPLEASDAVSKQSISGEITSLPTTVTGNLRVNGGFGHKTAPVNPQTVGAVINNVTSGGVNGTIADFTDLAVYATDAATIRNDIFQLARSVKQLSDALRAYGFGV